MVRVGIVGASGYTGVELLRLACSHPGIDVTLATSRQHAGQPVAAVFPHLKGRTDLSFVEPPAASLAESAELFFLAVPHQTAMAVVPGLLAAGRRVVDLSADFRLREPAVYEAWYQLHTATDLLSEAVYGLPEIHRQEIRRARLVANPGCYPTSVILGLTPLLAAGLVDPDSIIADSKSGTSGAGRGLSLGSLFCEVHDGFRAYKVASHRHTPEIEQELSQAAGRPLTVSFTPHLLPTSRGILSTMYARLLAKTTWADLDAVYRKAYAGEPFVRLYGQDELPATQYVRGSNFCDIGFRVDPRTNRVIVVAAIDNLGKGAASQAIQNMNILCGLDETTGLLAAPLFP
ncbi:MAG: N-acetyl-gamma-glutamyl-phosphate reductase [Thermodesulfobacteriota bacterium]